MKEDQPDKTMKELALKALRDALPYLDSLFSTQNVLDYVANSLVNCIRHQDKDIQQQALQTSIDFVKIK